MKRTIVVVIGLIKKRGKYLLTRRVSDEPRYDKKWQLPGGEMEFGETFAETVKRELREEIGAEVVVTRLVPKIFTRTDENNHYVLINCLCKLKEPNVCIKLNGEASEYGWYSARQIEKMDQLPQLSLIIQAAEDML